MKNFLSFLTKFNYKKIICFDGGGVRTIAALVFLKKLEAESGKKVSDIFDMFIGTSAGAFVAVLLCLNYEWETILKYFVERPWHEAFPISPTTLFAGIFTNCGL